MEIKGKVTAKPEAKTGISARGPWKKCFIVVQYEEGDHPKSIILSNMNKAEDFDRINVGDTGTFRFDGNVKEGNNGNYYMDLNCWSWKIEEDMPV